MMNGQFTDYLKGSDTLLRMLQKIDDAAQPAVPSHYAHAQAQLHAQSRAHSHVHQADTQTHALTPAPAAAPAHVSIVTTSDILSEKKHITSPSSSSSSSSPAAAAAAAMCALLNASQVDQAVLLVVDKLMKTDADKRPKRLRAFMNIVTPSILRVLGLPSNAA